MMRESSQDPHNHPVEGIVFVSISQMRKLSLRENEVYLTSPRLIWPQSPDYFSSTVNTR